MSFQDLKDQYQLAPTQFYRYLQLHHALLEHILLHTSLPEFNPLEAKVVMGRMGKRGYIQNIPLTDNPCIGNLPGPPPTVVGLVWGIGR